MNDHISKINGTFIVTWHNTLSYLQIPKKFLPTFEMQEFTSVLGIEIGGQKRTARWAETAVLFT